MPRTARERSAVGLYHVLLRGAEGRMIFADDEDCARFLDSLSHAREGDAFLLYAYCLMGTHAHLLIREASVPIDQAFKRIGASYARYYNAKYNQTGRLFQDRFQSEALNDNPHFLDAMRFICQNPVKEEKRRELVTFLRAPCEFEHLEVKGPGRLPDDKAEEQLARIANLPPAEIASLDKAKRNAILRMAHDAGISIRQLARLTGLGKTVVEHALKI